MTLSRLEGAAALCFSVAATVTMPLLAALPPVNGEALYRQRCQMCHSVVEEAKSSGVGPNLRGVVGRMAGTATFNYSNAMKQSKITWVPANLNRFLAAPTKLVPGTRMVVAVTDAAQRAAIIKYLSQSK